MNALNLSIRCDRCQKKLGAVTWARNGRTFQPEAGQYHQVRNSINEALQDIDGAEASTARVRAQLDLPVTDDQALSVWARPLLHRSNPDKWQRTQPVQTGGLLLVSCGYDDREGWDSISVLQSNRIEETMKRATRRTRTTTTATVGISGHKARQHVLSEVRRQFKLNREAHSGDRVPPTQ